MPKKEAESSATNGNHEAEDENEENLVLVRNNENGNESSDESMNESNASDSD